MLLVLLGIKFVQYPFKLYYHFEDPLKLDSGEDGDSQAAIEQGLERQRYQKRKPRSQMD